ncbi:DNA-directed RNA polymerase subunit alpha C-terminal domain-containing protein [Modestobacter sp. URMC 112]
MPNTTPGGVSARTVRDLSLPGRAVAALTRAGVTSIEDLAVLTRRELAAVPGLGPGLIAAIRLVVPEPAPGPPRPDPAGTSRPDAGGAAARRVPPPAEQESPAAPAIPSFASLRSPGGRTPVDVLFPDPVPAPAEPAPAAPPPPDAAAAPRPADYGDLLRIGRHLARAAVGVPGRVARWSVRQPVRCLGRLLGGGPGSDRG